ncbi:seryl-trna synthetase : Serine--tRNA ligase OS=Singulisphaera acidiphila (strain ATCC BAA-1392 / DSM 18658 / VKM B-2454 / MOB10) GN=serS PE=3 SV=1: Seryl_tRNA_N: tRNA-synt_2b [Gemmata massiliana]|uniref:Serine--tRNA ligase n=1 Tax=Gemmata massiliana TaxID=1210884 RepID=A0A6P2CZK2_9BACT|nr:serine--tRNA ligase [Gemmata massiliana]VTR94568.1 seryl-trna synthetase : Serine--tRNA ligase OS=Singulisphaera acidiphila (strain ATCC BAA-1392 / DSM 18658 / VKM B-2454 / MOB10) GN=serS PE=3 SV=1: Seryl_tRNA_N: tRNA-synt_2b [Gemmata massiliana]
MLDAGFIANNVDAVKANCKNRGVSEVPVERVVAFEAERKKLSQKRGETAAKKNAISAQFPHAKTPEAKQALKDQAAAIDKEVGAIDDELKIIEGDLLLNLYQIPNMTHPDAPVGGEAANKVVSQFGEPRKFDFKAKDHVDICDALDLADFEAGTTVAGQKFYFLKNEAALLEVALVQYAMQTAVKAGYTPVITPDLARVTVLEGIGFMPRDPNPETRQVYTVADTDLCLVGTAEITLGGMHMGKVFDESELPKRYVGLSHCFRTEAGAAGRDTRGLYRVHQFTKVEMFAFCTPENSDAIHQEIRELEEKIFTGLGLAFHVIDTATGDLGGPAYRKYDLEAWMPGRGDGGAYGEVTSTSNCTDFQSRRLNIRYKGKGFKGTRFVHTLNGTAVACTRALVAILENYQQADGSVVIPEVLRPWVGKDVIAPRKA